MKRTFFFKSLLLAAMLAVGGSAWAGILTPSAGLADNSTAWNTWDEGFTQNYTLSGNSSATFTFHYTADVTASDYAGWTLFIGRTINTTNIWDTWITCQGFSGGHYGGTVSGTRNSSNTFDGTLSASSCTEADVTLTVSRDAGVITAIAAVDPTNGADDYTITWTYTYDNSEDDTADLYLSFAIEKAYLNITNVVGTGLKTTQADIDFSNDIANGVIAGSVNSIAIGSNTAKGTNNGSGNLIIGNGTSTVTIPEAQYAGTRDQVTISFDLAFGKLTGKEVFFNAKDKDGAAIFNVSYNVYSDTFSSNTLDLSGGDWYHGYNTVLWDRRASLTIIIDYAAKTISTTVKNNFSGASTNHSVGLSNTNPVASFNIGSNYNNDGRRCEFDNLLIKTTIGDYTVSTAKYTVKYVCGGSEIKEAQEREGDVGSPISLFATDKATFDTDGKRYIYVSDDLAEKTIAGDGSTVVTITFREAAKYGYTITSSYSSTALPFTQSTQYVWENENSVTIQCPKYYNVDGTLVVAPLGSNGEPRKSFTITEDGFVGNIEYTATEITNLYLYSEAEDLEGTSLTVSDNTGANDRVSCGKLAYAGSSKLITLPAGKYIFTLGAWGGAGNEWTFVVKAGNEEIINSSCAQNTLKLVASSEFTLLGTTDITITTTNANRTRGIDLIYVQKTGDVEIPANVTATLGTNGYTTFASPYALDLTGVTAYKAAVEGNVVRFTELSQTVPANTGFLLEGTAGATVTIPVVAAGTEVSGNAFLVNATGETFTADEGYTYYGLLKNSNPLTFGTFAPGTVAIPADKAYLKVANAQAARLVAVFGDESTGINAVNVEGFSGNGSVYNLSGQRVAQPAKGLYIVNGKKVIVK